MAKRAIGCTKALLKFTVTQAWMVFERAQNPSSKRVCGVVDGARACDAAYGEAKGPCRGQGATTESGQTRCADRQTGGKPRALTHPLLEQRHTRKGSPILSEGSLQVRPHREVRRAPERILR